MRPRNGVEISNEVSQITVDKYLASLKSRSQLFSTSLEKSATFLRNSEGNKVHNHKIRGLIVPLCSCVSFHQQYP